MIEVTVKDTVTVYANQFEYHLTFNLHPDDMPKDESFSLQDYQAQIRQQQEKLKQLLSQYTFDYTELSSPSGSKILVTFNEEAVERFSEMLGEFGKTELNLRRYDERYDPLGELEETLSKKILQQARKKAQSLGKLTGLSVGRISQVTDKPMRGKVYEEPEELGLWMIYPPLSPQEKFLELMKQRKAITYQKELTVCFLAE